MTPLPSKKSGDEPRRWSIRQMNTPSGHVSLTQIAGAGLPWHETVEVMPVAEHDAARRRWAQDIVALHRKEFCLREAAQAVMAYLPMMCQYPGATEATERLRAALATNEREDN